MCTMTQLYVYHDSIICVPWMLFVWIRRSTHMYASYRKYELVMSHVWMVHVTRMNDARHTYQSVMSHMCECVMHYIMSHMCECVMPCIRCITSESCPTHTSHIERKIASCHTYKRVMVHIYMSHGTHIIESCRLDSFTSVPWLICMRAITHRMSDMTHSYIWHDSLVCVTWRTLMCDMTHLCVWHDALLCVTW